MLHLLILYLIQLGKIVIFMIVNSMSPFILFNEVYIFVPKGFLYHLLYLLLDTPYFFYFCWKKIDVDKILKHVLKMLEYEERVVDMY